MRILKNVDVLITDDNRILVTGSLPCDDDEWHNCDEMRCSSFRHVLVQGEARIIGVSVFDND